jgi:exopolyphosphatase/guanosine-5'-triphosphate,3'-diphosphate pyrophosphatase
LASNPIDSADLIAAVDLGSNSFRMLVAQAVNTSSGTQLRPVDTLRESVRLAAGLTDNKLLGNDAYQRGLTAIRRFGERIRGFNPAMYVPLQRILYELQKMLSNLSMMLK